MSIIASFKAVIADFKQAAINPNEIKDPKKLGTVCQLGKVFAVAAAVLALAAGFFGGPIGLIFAGVFALAMYDVFKMADNVQQIADKRAKGKDIPKPTFPEGLTTNISRGTIFARLILSMSLRKYEQKQEAK